MLKDIFKEAEYLWKKILASEAPKAQHSILKGSIEGRK